LGRKIHYSNGFTPGFLLVALLKFTGVKSRA
jgi:hypothetical protein